LTFSVLSVSQSEKYLSDNERILDLSARVSQVGGNGILSKSVWEELISADERDDDLPTMNTMSVRSLLEKESWKQSEEELQQIFTQVFALDTPEQVCLFHYLCVFSSLTYPAPP
jgi:hypothetical protein